MATSLGLHPRVDFRVEPQSSTPRTLARPPVARAGDERFNAVQALIAGYRLNGWRTARLDPLAQAGASSDIAELDPQSYGFAPDDSTYYSIEFGGITRSLPFRSLFPRLR